MPLQALALVITAALLHALWNVAAKKAGGELFAALIGGRLLGESDRGLRIGGALLMACGVAALAWG